MRALRISLGAAAALALFSAAPAARAGGGVPAYSALPSGRLTTVPTTKAPAFIPAREQVAGLFVVSPKFGADVPFDARHVTVVADAKQAEAIRSERGSGRLTDDDAGACFAESHRSMSAMMMGRDSDESEDEDLEWATSQMWQVNLWLRTKNNPQAGVTAVHSERVVTANGKTSLESVDAWVDPATHGARLISRSSLALEPVGSAIGGVKVYAGRDERANGKRWVQFVVVREGKTSAANRTGTLMGMRQDGMGVHGGGCGHLRMPLAVEANAGDSGVVLAPVELPAEKDRSATSAKAKDEPRPGDAPRAGDAKAAPKLQAVSIRRKGLGPKTILRRIQGSESDGPPPAPEEREARLRDMQVHLSVSQTSRDKAPILSVAFGWAGRETVQRVFEPPSGPGAEVGD